MIGDLSSRACVKYCDPSEATRTLLQVFCRSLANTSRSLLSPASIYSSCFCDWTKDLDNLWVENRLSSDGGTISSVKAVLSPEKCSSSPLVTTLNCNKYRSGMIS